MGGNGSRRPSGDGGRGDAGTGEAYIVVELVN